MSSGGRAVEEADAIAGGMPAGRGHTRLALGLSEHTVGASGWGALAAGVFGPPSDVHGDAISASDESSSAELSMLESSDTSGSSGWAKSPGSIEASSEAGASGSGSAAAAAAMAKARRSLRKGAPLSDRERKERAARRAKKKKAADERAALLASVGMRDWGLVTRERGLSGMILVN